MRIQYVAGALPIPYVGREDYHLELLLAFYQILS